ncbi:hypothetical protein D3C81_2063600 [compost metagenome]
MFVARASCASANRESRDSVSLSVTMAGSSKDHDRIAGSKKPAEAGLFNAENVISKQREAGHPFLGFGLLVACLT